ncbi:hypothetical protein [Arthrobacter sp. 18067]|uniref:hypothetical protein n=1 Tax=Arthrobacter sp. 18067 TaxID=2681413 RepID=UPI00135855E9|nr:hypothetical protein [Arthrobacter sp. 18067]
MRHLALAWVRRRAGAARDVRLDSRAALAAAADVAGRLFVWALSWLRFVVGSGRVGGAVAAVVGLQELA